MQTKWQEVTVDTKGAGHTYRLRVPGGYLYRTTTYRYPEKHAQWDAAVRKTGSIQEALATCDARNEATGGREFTREWCAQAQEIATQTTVFVRKGLRDPEKRRAKALEKARAAVCKTYKDYYNGLEAQRLASTQKPGIVVSFEPHKPTLEWGHGAVSEAEQRRADQFERERRLERRGRF